MILHRFNRVFSKNYYDVYSMTSNVQFRLPLKLTIVIGLVRKWKMRQIWLPSNKMLAFKNGKKV